MKRYILIAGVNGAGKSTLYRTLDSLQGMPRVNTDEIVQEFGDIIDLSKKQPNWYKEMEIEKCPHYTNQTTQ